MLGVGGRDSDSSQSIKVTEFIQNYRDFPSPEAAGPTPTFRRDVLTEDILLPNILIILEGRCQGYADIVLHWAWKWKASTSRFS
ncbi:hypothetical protein TNCV_1163101 [Trichonephila clavipes]|nr:hypothetical protein TNCV_1163101 [Trichonephila clavipes]